MNKHEQYIAILKEELVPAFGCTEPIAVAFACALAKKLLKSEPEKVNVYCSGNIVKNVKGVVVPNSGNLKGLKTAAVMGIVAGDSDKQLEVINQVSEEQLEKVNELLATDYCKVDLLPGDSNLHILAEVKNGENNVLVEIMHTHTNVVKITENGKVTFEKKTNEKNFNEALIDRTCLTIKDIIEFANNGDLNDIKATLEKQIELNMAISAEGIKNDYGSRVGQLLIENADLESKIIASAAAGSDARMSGCSLPVVTNSGSGNQGMTCSIPVIVYAREKGLSHERLLQGLIVSNLITIHLKTGIGRLSAFCGAVSAAAGSSAGITYLAGGNEKQVGDAIVNTLGTIAGMVCDGAKPSCANKIASAVQCALLSHKLAMRGIVFEAATGIIQSDIEKTIEAVGKLGREGMKETDEVILDIMLNS